MAFRTKHKVHKGGYVYVVRNAKGQITDVQNIGRATAADRRTKAKRVTGRGQGFRGDYSPTLGNTPKVRIGLY